MEAAYLGVEVLNLGSTCLDLHGAIVIQEWSTVCVCIYIYVFWDFWVYVGVLYFYANLAHARSICKAPKFKALDRGSALIMQECQLRIHRP